MKKLEIIDFFYKDRCFNVYLSEHDFYSIKESDIEILNHKTNNKEVFSFTNKDDNKITFSNKQKTLTLLIHKKNI